MKISNPLAVVLLCGAAAVSANSTTTATISKSESAQQSIMLTQTDAAGIHSMADDSFHHAHQSEQHRWLSRPLNGLKTFTEDVGARVTLRPRLNLKAWSEGALGQGPWYGMAFGLACTTLAALMLG